MELNTWFHTMVLLNNPDFAFHLTGSRFFNNARKSSDWDFFVQEDQEVSDFLHANGFKKMLEVSGCLKLRTIYPDDVQIVDVFQKRDVQIQLVRDAKLKATAQNLLYVEPVLSAFLKADKKGAGKWWLWTFKSARQLIHKH